jgi:hypothetical protein
MDKSMNIQLPYKRLTASDYIHELAPKKIAFNYKVPVPDMLRETLGETCNINITSLTDVDSLWHSLLYGLLTEKYTALNWHHRKLLVEKFITALDERLNVTFANNKVLKFTSFKKDDVNFKLVNLNLIFYITVVLNINIVVYNCGIVNKIEYHYPTGKYDPSLPLLILYSNDIPHYSIISVNDAFIFQDNSYTSKQIASRAPTEHKLLKHYLKKSCPDELYSQIHNVSLDECTLKTKKIELLKLKLSELKELHARVMLKLNLNLTLSCKVKRVTKESLVDDILKNI